MRVPTYRYVPKVSLKSLTTGLFSYTEDAIFQFHGIESKHRAFLIQGQFIPIHREDRAAGLLQDDPRRVVIPGGGAHGDEQIRPAGSHLTQLQSHGAETPDSRTFRESRIIRS